ncbi:hypothetical protein G4B88_029406 [Cannabis sativa]|uniref:Uncharacterized protein n=1 Tax=Cannabis sativa TaxID=3483 RepID=A0A7J6FZV1_CANSA|nr:hypothetical protein G4B88_029406 [Cannabis sativa]
MVSAIVRGHRLDGYLKGTKVKPIEFLPTDSSTGEESVTVNPEFEIWIVNDQLLLGWLYGSMTESIATEVMGCESSSSLWQALETLFGAHSRVKMDDYRTKIQTARKGAMSMAEYLRQKRQWADVLALAGDPYPEKQLVSNILSGLDIEYLPIVLQVEARISTTWQELQDILLSFDSKLDRLTTLSGATKNLNLSSPTANVAATKSSSFSGNRGSHNGQAATGSPASQVPGEDTLTTSDSSDQNQVMQTDPSAISSGFLENSPTGWSNPHVIPPLHHHLSMIVLSLSLSGVTRSNRLHSRWMEAEAARSGILIIIVAVVIERNLLTTFEVVGDGMISWVEEKGIVSKFALHKLPRSPLSSSGLNPSGIDTNSILLSPSSSSSSSFMAVEIRL